MARKKTDKEIYKEYWELMGYGSFPKGEILDCILNMVHRYRQYEPRINCGAHLADYLMICDEDDDMDSFYGQG